MTQSSKENQCIKSNKYVLTYTLLFCLLAVVMLSFFVINGRTLIRWEDPFEQDYPIFIYYGQRLRELLTGKGWHFFDFSIGFGSNVTAALNTYGWGDPLNIISVIGTPATAALLYSLLIVIRMYLAGLGAVLFSKHRELSLSSSALVGLLYSFSIFTFFRGMYFNALLNAMYIFPFLILFLEKLFVDEEKERKYGVGFAVFIGIQGATSFYFLYMVTLFLFIYAIIYCAYHYEDSFGKTLWIRFIRVIRYYLIGILLAGSIMFPAIFEFLKSSRNGTSALDISLFYPGKMYIGQLSNMFIPMIKTEYGLSLTLLGLIAIIYILAKDRIRTSMRKMIMILMIVGCVFPFVGSVTNGLQYVSDRWMYVFFFVISYESMAVWEEIKDNLVQVRYYGIVSGIIGVCSIIIHYWIYRDKIRSFVYLCILLVICAGILLNRLSDKSMRTILILSVAFDILFVFGPWQICGQDYWGNFRTYTEATELANISTGYQAAHQETARVEHEGTVRNQGIISGEKGSSFYFSIMNSHVFSFAQKLNLASTLGAPHALSGVDGRFTLLKLLGIKEYEYNDVTTLVDNPIPWGCVYSDAISSEIAEGLTPLEIQGLLGKYIIVNSGQDKIEKYDGIHSVPYEISFEDFNSVNDKLSAGSDAKIILKIDPSRVNVENEEVYVYICGLTHSSGLYPNLKVNGKVGYVNSDESRYSTGLTDYLYKVNNLDDGTIEISIGKGQQIGYKSIEVLTFDTAEADRDFSRLRESALDNVIIDGDKLTAEVDSDGGKLFLSIPYSEEWNVYIDGNKAECYIADWGFIGVDITPGHHELRVEYFSWVEYAGLLSSLCGVVIIIAFVLFDLKRNKK